MLRVGAKAIVEPPILLLWTVPDKRKIVDRLLSIELLKVLGNHNRPFAPESIRITSRPPSMA